MEMTMPEAGLATLAASVRSRPMFLAIGEGDEDWGNRPAQIEVDETGLLRPVALVRARSVDFIIKREDGVLESDTGQRWAISNEPTPYIHASFVLGFKDAVNKVLREMALYLDAKISDSIPPGREYIDMADVEDIGQLVSLKRFAPIHRMGTRQTFGEIMSF